MAANLPFTTTTYSPALIVLLIFMNFLL